MDHVGLPIAQAYGKAGDAISPSRRHDIGVGIHGSNIDKNSQWAVAANDGRIIPNALHRFPDKHLDAMNPTDLVWFPRTYRGLAG